LDITLSKENFKIKAMEKIQVTKKTIFLFKKIKSNVKKSLSEVTTPTVFTITP